MTDGSDFASDREWPQTESLLLLREVMNLGSTLLHVVSARVDLSETELKALQHIAQDSLGPAEIAQRLDVSTAASTGIVDRLEAKGHVHRVPHPQDRRRTQVIMTPHARAEVMRQMGALFAGVAKADAELTEAERAVVVRYLKATIAAAHGVLDTPQEPDPRAG